MEVLVIIGAVLCLWAFWAGCEYISYRRKRVAYVAALRTVLIRHPELGEAVDGFERLTRLVLTELGWKELELHFGR